MLRRTLCISLLLSTTSLIAQRSDSVGVPELRDLLEDLVVPIHSGPADPVGGDYGTWAGAWDYKVEFSDGFRFFPRLGPEAPESRSLAWRTESITIGARNLIARRATPSSTDHRYELDYGAVIEAYDVRTEGVEQTFVIPRCPALSGEVVVTGRVETKMHCATCTAAHRELEFTDNGRVLVTYGHALAFDAAGRRSTVTTEFDGERIRLRVPSEFVEDAVFPLTIDPLTAPVPVGLPGFLSSPTIAASDDPANPRLIIGYSNYVSALDRDAYVVTTDYQFQNPSFLFIDATASWSTPRVRTAMTGGPDVWVIGLERYFGQLFGKRARAYLQSVADLSTNGGSLLSVNPPVNLEHGEMEVAGSHGASRALMTFNERAINGITGTAMAVRIETTSGTLGTPFTVRAPAPFQSISSPSVTPMTTSQTDWVIATRTVSTAPIGAGTRIRLSRVPYFDGPLEHASLRLFATTEDLLSFQTPLAGSEGRYLLAYQMQENDAPLETTNVIRFDWPVGQGVTTIRDESVVEGPLPLFDTPSGLANIAYDLVSESHWVFGAQQQLFRLGFSGAVLEQLPASGFSAVTLARPSLVSEFPIARLDGGILGQHFTHPADAISSIYGNSCAAASVTFGSGPSYAGSQFFRPTLTGLPASTATVYMLAFAPAHIDLALVGLPGCFLEIDPSSAISIPVNSNPSGQVAVEIALPDDPLFVGDLFAQWFYFDNAPTQLRAYYGIRHQVR